MKIETLNKIGTCSNKKSVIKSYRSNPGNFDNACNAALHYAIKFNENMVVIPGNSYMNKVYHIEQESKSLNQFTPLKKMSVALVKTNGEVFQAIAIKEI